MIQKKINILFRISGGRAFEKELGTGHVYRAMHLAHQLKPNHVFFLIEDYGKINEILTKHGFKNIYPLKKEINLDCDIKVTIKIIKQKKIDILIVDKFDINTKKYVKSMHKLIKTVVIPDVNKIDYDVDLIANGFIGFENKVTYNRYGTKCLLGPKYQILNKKFEKNNTSHEKKYTILATFGGFDEHNIVNTLCYKLEKNLDKITAKIILGAATKKSKKIKFLESKYPKRLQIIQETKNMKKEISHAEFGICSGGITTYEFTSLGVPFVIICQYKHQLKTAREWQKRNIALNFGLPNKQTRSKIQNLIKKIAENKVLVKPNKSIVDGLGAKRVAHEILKI